MFSERRGGPVPAGCCPLHLDRLVDPGHTRYSALVSRARAYPGGRLLGYGSVQVPVHRRNELQSAFFSPSGKRREKDERQNDAEYGVWQRDGLRPSPDTVRSYSSAGSWYCRHRSQAWWGVRDRIERDTVVDPKKFRTVHSLTRHLMRRIP